jgi:hypothetical protein
MFVARVVAVPKISSIAAFAVTTVVAAKHNSDYSNIALLYLGHIFSVESMTNVITLKCK